MLRVFCLVLLLGSSSISFGDDRTATELPDKRKIPTAHEVGINPEESDRQIRVRLQRIARSQDVFKNIEVKVSEGIVVLGGNVEELPIAKSFSGLSERVEGVIGVVDRLEIEIFRRAGFAWPKRN